MTKQDRTLRALRDLLYGQSWEAMRADLLRRLDGRPYCAKLHDNMIADLERIEEIMAEAK